MLIKLIKLTETIKIIYRNNIYLNKLKLEQMHYNKWVNIIGDLEKWKSLTDYEQMEQIDNAAETFFPLQLEDQQNDLLQLSQKHHEGIKALRSQYENE